MRISICVGPFGGADFSRPEGPKSGPGREARALVEAAGARARGPDSRLSRFDYLVPITSIAPPLTVAPLPLEQLTLVIVRQGTHFVEDEGSPLCVGRQNQPLPRGPGRDWLREIHRLGLDELRKLTVDPDQQQIDPRHFQEYAADV